MTRACCIVLPVFASLILVACDNSNPEPTSPDLQSGPSVTLRDGAGIAGLGPLPRELGELAMSRLEYVPRIDVEPHAATRVSEDAIRSALRAHQQLVESTMQASKRLTGELPPHVALTEEQVGQGLHLSQPRTVLLGHVRLLRADAIRCWELRDAEACTARLIAAFDIAAFLLTHDDQESKF